MMNAEKKTQAIHRLKRIEGQIRGLQKMIEEDRYCIDILTQSTSVVSALHKTENLIMEQHLNTCVTDAIRSGDPDEKHRKIEEIMDVLSKFRTVG